MKSFFASLAAVLFFSNNVIAATLCRMNGVQDASFIAIFDTDATKNWTVVLGVPSGETSSSDEHGTCKPVVGSIEFAISCEVPTKTHGIYEVSLRSTGGSNLVATIGGGDLLQPVVLDECVTK